MDKQEKPNPLLDQNGALKENAKEKILRHASNVECECPAHLLKVAEAINAFQVYETNCLITDLKQKEIHEWLLEKSYDLELEVSKVIIELMQKEGFVDKNNEFCLPPELS
jgi:hypothetical protein